MTYARQLKPARLNQGRTKADVAEAAGISRNTYSSMESGDKVPQANKLWAAMLELGIRPDRQEPEWLQEWWRIIEPLATRLDEPQRGIAMARIMEVLLDALRGDAPRRITAGGVHVTGGGDSSSADGINVTSK